MQCVLYMQAYHDLVGIHQPLKSIFIPNECHFDESVQIHMEEHKHAQNASSNIQFLSAGTALLDKHKLTADVVNTKPAGCNSGELKALWQSDSFFT